MSNYGPRIPLHMQNADVKKAADANPSWESFRPNVVHPTGKYADKDMQEERATLSQNFRVRRYPSGQLDEMWTANQIIDAIHATEFNGTTGDPNLGSASLTPLQVALLTVVFPAKYRKMEPMQAEILTQLSDTEKQKLQMIVAQQFANEQGWNAGLGGGTVPGSRVRNVGG
jgi:hypothetical protein